ncbi:hypothetical protein DAEQUDRAFT_726828 [Daedalea quercina L-15889]|uniref:RING-type domain-containing protein n=1 Tax=Daedalea quercina L-15889 TaxID=1314783 RepID=A0A165QBL7_9APHY|nr:hypothetical protein DAEQUDRAFT_726828 [Daedalea quercina L-15889]
METRFKHQRRPSIVAATRASKARSSRSAKSSGTRAARKSTRKQERDSDAEEAAVEETPQRALKRPKVANEDNEEGGSDTAVPVRSPSPPKLRRSSRHSDAAKTATAVDDDDAPSSSQPTRKLRASISRSVSVAARDSGTSRAKEAVKAPQARRSLKRDRQTLEEETEPTSPQLDKREIAIQKKEHALQRKEAQLEGKIAVAQDKEQAAQKRENAVQKREDDCTAREAKLEAREVELRKREQETQDRALVVNISRSEEAIGELEARWQCALCFDVMACPYSLSPAGCGHTYCAICILKWFFTNLCNACGDWCYSLECPLCRAVLPRPVPPTARPRPMFALPFTPARAADERVTLLIDSLCGSVPESPSKASNSKRSRGKGKKKQVVPDASAGPSTGWEHGGALRAEWQERDSRGRTEMRNLVINWPHLSAAALRETKTRICAST